MRHIDGKHTRPILTADALVGRIVSVFLTFLLTSCGGSSDAPVAPARPLGNDASLSSLSVSGIDLNPSFHPSVTEYSASVGFAAKSTEVAATAADANATVSVNGASVPSGAASDPIPLDEGSNTITINVTAEDGSTTRTYTTAVFRQSASDFAETAFLQSSDAKAFVLGRELLGGAVALSDDGTTLAAGAHGKEFEAGDTTAYGAAYIFARDVAGVWIEQTYVRASNPGLYDEFGKSVALSGDGMTLAVGAPAEDSAATGVNGDEADNSAYYAGAVYVFSRDSGEVWTQLAYVKASNTDTIDNFGTTLALSDDGATLVVGAPGEDSAAIGVNGDETDNSALGSGAVYVFTRDSAGTWTQQAYIKASNTEASDGFGKVVALSGDGTTLVVGAHCEDSAATGVNGDEADNSRACSGAAYVYTFDRSAHWTQRAYLKASNTDMSDLFASSAALSDDGSTLVVSAPQEGSAATGVNGDETDNSALGSGAVYVFTRDSAGTWTQQAYIKASNAGMGDRFGWFDDPDWTGPWPSIALSDDGTMLAVGAMAEDSDATEVNGDEGNDYARDAGAAYVFTRDSVGLWTQRAYIKGSDLWGNDRFGAPTLSGSGSTLAVGAPGNALKSVDSDGTVVYSYADVGAVYIFEL